MPDKQVWRDFIAVTIGIAIVGIGLGCTLPLTALALSNRGQGLDVIGWMIAAAALGGVTGTLITPWVTDLYGRRNVMLACFLIATVSVMALQYTVSIPDWLCLRFLFGLSMAALFLIGEAWINILAGNATRGRVVAIYTTSFTLFQILGPFFTDWISGYPQYLFLLCGALFMLGVPGILLASDKAVPQESDSNTKTHDLKQETSWIQLLSKTTTIIPGTRFGQLPAGNQRIRKRASGEKLQLRLNARWGHCVTRRNPFDC